MDSHLPPIRMGGRATMKRTTSSPEAKRSISICGISQADASCFASQVLPDPIMPLITQRVSLVSGFSASACKR